MSWTITGNSEGLLLGVTKYGNPVVRGVGSHVPYFPEDPAGPALRPDYSAIQSALRRLQTVQTDWRIMSSAVAREELGALHPDFVARIETQPQASVVSISCIDREKSKEPTLSFEVALQPPAFRQVHKLFAELITGPKTIEYTISVRFLTFRYPGATVDIPTLDEFLSGVPYFSNEVSLSIHRVKSSDA